MTPDNAHRWTLTRFAARRAGLLDDAEEQRIEGHLAACGACAAAWQADASGTGDPAEQRPRSAGSHLPPGMLAVWPRARESLRGFERAMVREHLERCETCRQDLELLGYTPKLETVPELEWSGATASSRPAIERVDHAEELEPDRVIRVYKLPPARPDWMRWAFGGWAALASAAAFLLVINPGLVGRGGEGVSVEGPVIAPPIATPRLGAPPLLAPSPPRLAIAGSPIRLRPPVRGNEPEPVERTIGSDTRFLPLTFEPLALPDSSSVVVTIQREGDSTVTRMAVRNRDLGTGRLLFMSEDRAFQTGTYLVRLKGGPAPDAILPEPEAAEYRFALRRAPSPSRP